MEIRDYGQDQELAKQFFRDFSCVDDDGQTYPKYTAILTDIANREQVHLLVEMNDVEQFNQDLAFQITRNTKRYVKIFYQALDQILPLYKTKEQDVKDPMDVFIEQRLFVAERIKKSNQTATPGSQAQAEQGQKDIDDRYPPELIRRYELTFKPATLIPTPIRKVLAEHIGKLITVRGIVTRATDVKPKIVIATYNCDQCGCETFQPINDMVDYTPLFECTSAACKATKALGKISMQTRGSKFVKFQEVKLQEHSDQVPTGHIPRTITIMVHGELSRSCSPGDHISVSGIFLPIEKSGFRMRTGGLTADTYIDAHYITQMNKGEEDELNDEPMTPEEAAIFTSGDSNFLKKLSSSIAPEIFGHENLKKALLLLLVGGVDKTSHGMKIRGNINICLMGDPGVAKSQLLSFIDRLATRSQYTTGRGSSGVGLTAAVLRDPITNEMVLEGGALVLADEGICCIDEFDKMMDSDRTAIHEVMEQQTVSIAKAGIMTTLNARVSILAAANPAYGRYNTNKTVADNLQLPPALLSRFDLIWLIKDTPEESKDLDLAQHITSIHQNPGEQPPNEYDSIDMKVMRRYINLCKLKIPVVPHNLDDKFVKIYLDIRAKKRVNYDEGLNSDTLFTSPRSLLAIIRLSTAFARLRLADIVDEADVQAAVDLYNSSRESIENDLAKAQSIGSKIFGLIRGLLEDRQTDDLQLDDVQEECEKAGFSREQFDKAVKELERMDLIYTSGDTLRCIH